MFHIQEIHKYIKATKTLKLSLKIGQASFRQDIVLNLLLAPLFQDGGLRTRKFGWNFLRILATEY